MPHPKDSEQHVLPREPYTQSAPTQKPVPPLINVRLLLRDAFDSLERVLLGGSKYMYLRLLLRDVLSILARNGAERRRSGASRDGTVTANSTGRQRHGAHLCVPYLRYTATTTLIAFIKILGQRERDGETPVSNGSVGRADVSLFVSAII